MIKLLKDTDTETDFQVSSDLFFLEGGYIPTPHLSPLYYMELH